MHYGIEEDMQKIALKLFNQSLKNVNFDLDTSGVAGITKEEFPVCNPGGNDLMTYIRRSDVDKELILIKPEKFEVEISGENYPRLTLLYSKFDDNDTPSVSLHFYLSEDLEFMVDSEELSTKTDFDLLKVYENLDDLRDDIES